VNLFGLATGLLAGMVFYPLFGPWGLLLAATAGAILDAVGRRTRGAETGELAVRLYALWGTVTARGEVSEAQRLFLRATAGRLQLGGSLARRAFEAFESSRASAEGRPWSEVLARARQAAREIEESFLDRRTLLWIYEASRRLAALGTVRPGLAELLDAVAQTFSLFDEVGSAGLGEQDNPYDKAWRNFRPASEASPEAYRALGLGPQASADEIKSAYRSLVRRLHPDAHAARPEGEKQSAAEKFLHVQQAYERIRRARNF
jgi:DnaJ like chaperone protein